MKPQSTIVKESFEIEGYKLISKYVHSHTKLNYVCPNGHYYSVSWSNWQWKKGYRCPYCSNHPRVSIVKICTKCKRELPATREFFHKALKYLHSICKECRKEESKERYIQNKGYYKRYFKENEEHCQKRYQEKKEEISKYRREWYQNNKEELSKKNKKYYQNNKNKILKRIRRYLQTSRGKEVRRRSEKKRRKKYRLSHNMSTLMRQTLKQNKKGRSWRKLTGYGVNDLALHLQRTIGLTDKVVLTDFWSNFYGQHYHIDHIVPIAYFAAEKLMDADSEEFKQCWSLDNLQLLSPEENIKKGAKLLDKYEKVIIM